MSPEQKQINELTQQLRELRDAVVAMQNAHTVTPEFSRILSSVNILSDSGKSVSSITQSVDEAGAGTYNVARLPDGFKQIGGLNFWFSN